MKLIFCMLITITTMLIFMCVTGCSSKENYDYLSKDLISLQDIEKLFKGDGIKLIYKEPENTEFDILQKKHSNVYLIDNDSEKSVRVYVFSSEGERKKARLEFSDKTVLMLMTYHEIYYTTKKPQ